MKQVPRGPVGLAGQSSWKGAILSVQSAPPLSSGAWPRAKIRDRYSEAVLVKHLLVNLDKLHEFDEIIDVRMPLEYASTITALRATTAGLASGLSAQ